MKRRTVLKIGDRYNLLTILELAEDKHGRPAYLCQCTCGKKVVTEARAIISSKAKSCGCLRSVIGQAHTGYPYKNYIGKKFDRLTVLEYDYSKIGKGSHLLCECDCGNKKVVKASKLVRSEIKSCGCKHKEYKEMFKQKYGVKHELSR